MKELCFKTFKGIMVVWFSTLVLQVKSQTETNNVVKNAVYAEIGGPGGYGSVNYDRIFINKGRIGLSSRIGLSCYHFYDYTSKFNPDIIIPLMASGIYGKTHYLEINIGQTFTLITETASDFKPRKKMAMHSILGIGYRYQRPEGGFLFKCNYYPLFEFNRYLRHWAGIAVGYSF